MTARMPAARKEEADEDLVARVLGGETTAFRVLVERYQTLVLRLVRNFAPRSSAHEDLAQDAFVAAFIGLDRFDGGRGSFAAWLYTIARNKCINASKKGSSAESVGVKRAEVARRSSRSSHRGIVRSVPPASNAPSAGRGKW